jgi:hypothetical protein
MSALLLEKLDKLCFQLPHLLLLSTEKSHRASEAEEWSGERAAPAHGK